MRRKVSGNGCKMIDQLVTEADPFWLKYRNWYWARTMLSPGSVIPGRNECSVKQLVATIWMDRVHKTHFTEEQNSLLLLNAIRAGFNISYWCAIQIFAQNLQTSWRCRWCRAEMLFHSWRLALVLACFLAAWKNRMTYCDSIILIKHVQVLEFLVSSYAWSWMIIVSKDGGIRGNVGRVLVQKLLKLVLDSS